jgi:hypothetical protein
MDGIQWEGNESLRVAADVTGSGPIPKPHIMKIYGRVDAELHRILIAELDSDECSASHSGSSFHREERHVHRRGG